MKPSLLQQFMHDQGADAGEIDLLVERGDRVVFRWRAARGDQVVKLDPSPGAFAQEALAMRTMAAAGAPVSEVMLVDAGPPAILIANWAEGEPVTADSGRAVLREIGVVLRRIHRLPARGPWSAHDTLAGWITAWVAIVAPWWLANGADARDIVALEAWLETVRPLLDDTHGRQMLFDGRPEHFLVDANGQLHVIDVADLQPGDPVMDLAVLELDAPGILPHVLEGYGPASTERERIEELVPFYVTLRALSGAEWRARVGGDPTVVARYLAVARRMPGEWTGR